MGLNRILHYIFFILIVVFYTTYVVNLSGVRNVCSYFGGRQPLNTPAISSGIRNWSSIGYWTDEDGRIVNDDRTFTRNDLKHLSISNGDLKNQNSLFYSTITSRFQPAPVKTIMYWKPGKAAKSPLDFQDCEYSACAMTDILSKADVLWLDVNSLKYEGLPPRPPNQIWLFGSRDPPDLPMFDHLDRPDLNDQVNWTWYLRRDSTWQARYGHLQERSLPSKQYSKIFYSKQYDVAWFVSQCDRPSRRMEYVRRLRTEVDVHIYGLCGNFTCGSSGYHMGNKREECLNMLSRSYKFYLAFENSFCIDYVTEKFFNLFNEVDTIPVVRGGFEYSKFFPKGIYIDAADFPSPESLGAHLRELASDKERYVSMLKRKNRFTRADKPITIACELCKAAHLRQPQHVYKNLYRWLRAPGNCWGPGDL